MKVLVIDDEPLMIEVMALMLNDFGIEYDSVLNGSDGIKYCIEKEYDIIFVDLMMPGISGYDVVSKVRQKGVSAPIVILSALTGSDSISKAIEVGADDFLSKPFSRDELINKIRTFSNLAKFYSSKRVAV